MSGTLVLVRHGQSDWNLKNLFTGWKDPDLTELGIQEANTGGAALAEYGIKFDVAYTSVLVRAQHTLKLILDKVGQPDLLTIRDQALNERDYGDLSGLNKDDARAKWGEEQVHIWRRSYDVPPPAVKACVTPAPASGPTTSQKSCRACSGARRCWLPRTAIRCARSSWCSTSSPAKACLPSISRPACRWSTR